MCRGIRIGANGVHFFSLAGAGNAAYIDAFAQLLESGGLKDEDLDNQEPHEAFGRALRDFYVDRVVAAYIEQIEPRVFQAAVTGKRAIGKVANAMENAKVAITGIIEGTPFRFTKEEGEEGPTPED